MLIFHYGSILLLWKQNNVLFWGSYSGSSSCIRHANYIYLFFQMNTQETMKKSCLWQVLGAYLTCLTKLPKSAFQLSQERKHFINPGSWRYHLTTSRYHLTTCSVTPEPWCLLFISPLSQSSDNTKRRQLTAHVESPGISRLLPAEAVPSSSCHASGTETWGMRSEMRFRSTVKRGCLAVTLVKSMKTSEQTEKQRDWEWPCSLGISWSQEREGRRSQTSQSISDPRVKKKEDKHWRKIDTSTSSNFSLKLHSSSAYQVIKKSCF